MSGISLNEQIESELLNTQGFINIDQRDIEHLKRDVEKIESASLECPLAAIETAFVQVLLDMKKRNPEMQCMRILFVLKFSEQTVLKMDDMSFIDEVMNRGGEELECVWGMAVDNGIPQGLVKIMVLCGFNNID